MALYRAKALLFVDRLVSPGEEFASDLPPGINWEPMDDAARGAVAARFPQGAPAVSQPGGNAPAMTAIPPNWRELPKPQILALARKLGAPAKGTGIKQAEQHIEREIAQRGLSSPARAREAA
jgi:hypothetical protein